MDKLLFQNEPVESRRSQLRGSCDRVIEFSYMKRFTAEELNEMKSILSDFMIDLDKLETQLDDIKSEYKEKMKPQRDQVRKLLVNLRFKAELVTEECYLIYENEMALIYNGEGELIHTRPVELSERQKTIFSIQRSVVNP